MMSNALEEIPPPAVLGELYASYTFDAGAQGWTTTGVPTWSRSAPGTTSGADDPLGASFGLEGPTQYVDNMSSSLVSPRIATHTGRAVVQAWLKHNTEAGFDFVRVEWRRGRHGTGACSTRTRAERRLPRLVSPHARLRLPGRRRARASASPPT